jgi:hypothetical protein
MYFLFSLNKSISLFEASIVPMTANFALRYGC